MTTSRRFGWATLLTASIALAPAIVFTLHAEAASPPSQASDLGMDRADAARLTALLVLFLPWEDPQTPPIPGGDPKGGGGTGKDPGGNNGSGPPQGGSGPPQGGSGPPQGGTDPPQGGTDPPQGGTDPPVTNNPEPATLISGGLGLGLLALARWRRRRSQ